MRPCLNGFGLPEWPHHFGVAMDRLLWNIPTSNDRLLVLVPDMFKVEVDDESLYMRIT